MKNSQQFVTGGPDAPACAGCALTLRDDHSIDRLTFLKHGAAVLAALALVACGADASTAPTSVPSTTIKLADNASLASVGGIATLSIDGTPVAVVRESTSSFSAFSLICPHQGSTVQARSSSFYCPGHGATFSITGQWTGGQSTSNLRSYPAVYDASTGTVTVGG